MNTATRVIAAAAIGFACFAPTTSAQEKTGQPWESHGACSMQRMGSLGAVEFAARSKPPQKRWSATNARPPDSSKSERSTPTTPRFPPGPITRALLDGYRKKAQEITKSEVGSQKSEVKA